MAADALRLNLSEQLDEGAAHATFEAAVADFPEHLRGTRPAGVPHTGWRLIEHMRIAQSDIVAFSRDARHQSPPWPNGYWPDGDGPPSVDAWERSIDGYRADREAMSNMIRDPLADLLAPLPHGQGRTLAREVMLLADHTAYHVGQLIVIRQALGCWPE